MNISTKRTIWLHPEQTDCVQVLDQRVLPHQIQVVDLRTVAEVVAAIRNMTVRGAPLIGATAAFGVYFACKEAAQDDNPEAYFARSVQQLRESRPTAVNLFWALQQMEAALAPMLDFASKAPLALKTAISLVEADVEVCRGIGEQGLPILQAASKAKNGNTLNILTHCNAGRLGCIEWGTITAPIYMAFEQGMDLHVWVDETRPRNQGSSLTAWELSQAGIPHTVIVDNAGGHLMQHGMVDLVLVGADRVTRKGDTANKIGTYLKALAAHDNQTPFYVALPSTTIDWNIQDGLGEIPIEMRSPDEVRSIQGWDGTATRTVWLTPPNSPALNVGFDVTPARLITGFITERGVCAANESGLLSLFPEFQTV